MFSRKKEKKKKKKNRPKQNKKNNFSKGKHRPEETGPC